MKQLFLFILFCLTLATTYSQPDTDRIQHLNLKKGIYFSFEQITTNNPALADSFVIKERTNGNIVMWGGGKHSLEFKSKDKAEFKKIRKEIIGISDGKDFYISDKFTVGGWQGMTLCLLSGPFIIAPIQAIAGQYTGGGLIPFMIKVGSVFLINLNNGISRRLSKRLIREVLEKYPDLSQEYADKGDLIEFAVEIMDKINKAEKKE